jgi:pilus assembly protein CpaE
MSTALYTERERAGSRVGVLAFATDAETESVLRDGLAAEADVEVRRGEIADVTRALQRGAAPQVLIVDISGVAQPLTALGELSQLVEPDTRVLAIGDREDLALYRSLTRGLGLLEYLFKPLTREIVATHFAPLIAGRPGRDAERVLRGGRLIAVTGVHGGVGATTIAANLAWVIAERGKRHTLLLDGDLYGGTAAMLLSAKLAPGLRAALETPDRVDELFIERTAQRLGERLHVLAGEGKLSESPRLADGAAARLVDALRRRFNVLVCDAPWPQAGIGRELYATAHQRILVTEPSLLGARDLLRYLAALPDEPAAGGGEPRRGARRPRRRIVRAGDWPQARSGHSAPEGGSARGRQPRRAGGREGGAAACRAGGAGAAGRVRRVGPEAPVGSRMNAPIFGRRPADAGHDLPELPISPGPAPPPSRETGHAAGADVASELRALCLARVDPSSVVGMTPERLAVEVERLVGDIATSSGSSSTRASSGG